MKRWAIILGIVTLLIVWQLLLVYNNFKGSELDLTNEGLTVAKEKAAVVTAQSVTYYPGDGGYVVINGKQKDGADVIVWVQNGDVWSERLANSVDQKQLRAQLSEAVIKRITPGMMTVPRGQNGAKGKKDEQGEKRPLWEVYYETATGESYYECFDYKSGKSVKKIEL
ncbi:cell wall elongation regulator TseB-like domain-containing protein [Numidum massiliense]|uniref:cell wall elongation regulator TseB-like domain-containing protein n=1 Tax=Numidum massiliense TaxID=1522315 RepID=UPI0006D54BC5|nr:DUF5590 domain-containing protein [Numidum massiliense]